MSIYIEFDTITYLVNKSIHSTFFKEIATWLTSHNMRSFKCNNEHKEVFEVINYNMLETYLANGKVVELSDEKRLAIYRKIKYSYDYFQIDCKILYDMFNAIEQASYELQANNYIISVLDQCANLKINGINLIFNTNLYNDYGHRFDFKSISVDADVRYKNLSIDTILKYSNARDMIKIILKIDCDYPVEKLIKYCTDSMSKHYLCQYSKDINTIKTLPFCTNYDLVRNVHIDRWTCLDIYDSLFKYYNKGFRMPNKNIADIILQKKEFHLWRNISGEFLPVDIIYSYIDNINPMHLQYNTLLSDDFYDRIIITNNVSLMSSSNVLTEKFLHRHLIEFNPNNKRLSKEFIFVNVDRINWAGDYSNWDINDAFASAILERVHNNDLSNAVFALINNTNISYDLFKKYMHVLRINEFHEINRYEFINDNIHRIYEFQQIPLRIFQEYRLFTLFNCIKHTHDSTLLKSI